MPLIGISQHDTAGTTQAEGASTQEGDEDESFLNESVFSVRTG